MRHPSLSVAQRSSAVLRLQSFTRMRALGGGERQMAQPLAALQRLCLSQSASNPDALASDCS